MPNQQARDGNNNDRQFGGDEFEVNVFFLMDDNYGEDETASDAPEHDDGSAGAGDEQQRSRITVRNTLTCNTPSTFNGVMANDLEGVVSR